MNINSFQECMQLRGCHDDGVSAVLTPARWIDEGPGLETFLAQPEAALLPNQRFESPSVAPEKYETVSRIGVFAQHVLHHQGERIDSTTHVLVPSGNEDAIDG